MLPELVALDDAGDPASVKYHVLPALLLAEVQRLERERVAGQALAADQALEIARLRGDLQALRTRLDEVAGRR